MNFSTGIRIVALMVCIGSAHAADAMRVLLKNGTEMQGHLLREREDAVLLDLGFTVLNVPRVEIATLEKLATKAAAAVVAAAKGEDIYYVEPGREPLTVEKNVDRVAESVVQIQTASGLGSGSIINKLGYVMTNQHVIAGEREISVVVYRKRPGGLEKQAFTKVKIIAMNGVLDLAILQIDDPAADTLPFVPYFMWNFVGRQTAEQGYFPWDISKGNWQSGIGFIDENKLYKMDQLPDAIKNDESRNTYYFLPLIFGLLGLIYHFVRKREEFIILLILFVITGVGIVIYSNQPPNEPRERDYVLVGSFVTFSIWIGMGVLAIYQFLASKMQGIVPAAIAGLLVLSAPVIMGFQNFDDHSRKHHQASRYASNFLNSLEPN